MSQNGPLEDEQTPLICLHCGRELAWCSFCDEKDCSEPSCFTCTVAALGESIGALHEHGG